MNPYLKQKASPWVSAAVLVGGIATTAILVMLFRLQTKVDNLSTVSAEQQQIISDLKQSGNY